MKAHGYEVLFGLIAEIAPVSIHAFELLFSHCESQNVKKGEDFIIINRTNNSEYFLMEGICRSYILNQEGEDVTLNFFQGKTVISPHVIRTVKNKSILNFQALTDIELITVDAKAFLNLMINNLEIRDFGNTVLKNELIQKVEKEIGLISLSGKERLLQFRKQFNMLENLIPHPQIASYLGLTNISLSRLRGELAKEK